MCYVTSTRENVATMMAMDAPVKFYEHLRRLGDRNAPLDLFIHSNGGDGTVPWRLVTLLREYCSELRVLVPHRAFSAATLTALGADKIVMHPMGMLGPTDPTINGPFNPPNPLDPKQFLGINVEDVTAYISLIKEEAGINHEDQFVEAFKILAEKVHPLALGSVKRSLSQSRMMAKKLLALHMDPSTEKHKIDLIVDNLTSKLFYHGHPINRTEAANQVGLVTVDHASPELEVLMWRLYEEYNSEMGLDQGFNLGVDFTGQIPDLSQGTGRPVFTPEKLLKTAYVESIHQADVFSIRYQLSGVPQMAQVPGQPGQPPVLAATGVYNVNFLKLQEGWSREEN